MLKMISEGFIKITETVSEGSVFVNQSDCLILESLFFAMFNTTDDSTQKGRFNYLTVTNAVKMDIHIYWYLEQTGECVYRSDWSLVARVNTRRWI